jgi:hypothetical protein
VRLKGRSPAELRKWRRVQQELGYLPHYHKCGRVLMEVRFVLPCRRGWCVLNLVTRTVHHFRQNGTPLNGTRGSLIGPLMEKRKVKHAS